MRIGIVGGGITGLSAAYYLSKKGHRVTLFEKDKQLGGLASGVKIGGVFVDKYYRHIFTRPSQKATAVKPWMNALGRVILRSFSEGGYATEGVTPVKPWGSTGDRYITSLIAELGLSKRLSFEKPQTSIFYQERIYPFTSSLDLLRFLPLTLLERLRFGLVSLYLKQVSDGQRFSSVTAQDWLKKFYGPRSYKIVWGPLLRSKFGEYAFGVSMAWFWSRIHDRSFSLGYLQGGFQVLVDKLEEVIRSRGGEILLNAPLASLADAGEFDKVIVTTPLPIFLDLAENLPEDYVKELRTIQFRSALSLVLVFKESFMKPYWLNINDEDFPFVAVVEHTNFIPSSEYEGKSVLYIGSYLDPSDEKLKISDEDLFDLYLPYLKRINPEFSKGWVEQRSVFKNDFAQPVVTTDYAAKIPPLETPLKNVYLATMAQVYPQDRGMNQAIKLGKDAAETVEA